MVTKEDVKKSAKVSKIEIDDFELEKYVDDLNDMMRFIDMINEKDFNNEDDFKYFNNKGLEPRRDKVCPSLAHEDVFKNSRKKDGDFFALKRKE